MTNFDAWQATEIDRLNAQAQRVHDEEMREFGEWVMESEEEVENELGNK